MIHSGDICPCSIGEPPKFDEPSRVPRSDLTLAIHIERTLELGVRCILRVLCSRRPMRSRSSTATNSPKSSSRGRFDQQGAHLPSSAHRGLIEELPWPEVPLSERCSDRRSEGALLGAHALLLFSPTRQPVGGRVGPPRCQIRRRRGGTVRGSTPVPTRQRDA